MVFAPLQNKNWSRTACNVNHCNNQKVKNKYDLGVNEIERINNHNVTILSFRIQYNFNLQLNNYIKRKIEYYYYLKFIGIFIKQVIMERVCYFY